MRGDVVGGRELHGGEGQSAGERGRPGLAQAAPPVDQEHQQQRYDEGEQRGLAADDRGDGVQGQAGDLGEGDDGGAHGAEGDRRGVGDERDDGGPYRGEAEGDQHHRADRDGRPEPGERFEQRAEAEGDDQGLDAGVGGESGEGAAQDVEVAGADRHPVHPQGVDDDPQDGEQAEERALRGGGQRLPGGHAVAEAGGGEGDGEADESGAVGAHPYGAEQDEDGDQRECGDERGQGERAGHGFQLLHELPLRYGHSASRWAAPPSLPPYGSGSFGSGGMVVPVARRRQWRGRKCFRRAPASRRRPAPGLSCPATAAPADAPAGRPPSGGRRARSAR